MAHVIVPEAEALLDQPFPVLDKGFVTLVDYLGGDARIVEAARNSVRGAKTYRRDRALIDYLMRNRHTTPFEFVDFTFHVKLPIFVARQWIRHRTASTNEQSARYSVMPNEFYVPDPSVIQYQAKHNKQGRSDEEVPPDLRRRVLEILLAGNIASYHGYQEMIDEGIARELARINLPVSLYTQWYWKINLHNLFHFLKLRMDPHAQYEIRVYAEAMAKMAKAVAPMAFEAFEEHVLYAVHFSRTEMRVLRQILALLEDDERTGVARQHLRDKALDRFLSKLRTA